MEYLQFVWRDVSGESEIQARAEQAPELREALVKLGFRSVGYIERWMPWMAQKKNRAMADKMLDKRASKVLKYANWVQEVLAGPDGRAMVSVRKTPVGSTVNFRTVSDAGWIVDTGSGVPRGSDFRRNLLGLLARLMGAARPIGSKADSGFFHLEKAVGTPELWELHKRRVQSILEDGGQTLRPQDDPALYAAGSYHFQRILGMQTQASIRYTRVLCVIWLVLALLVYIGLCAFLYGSQAADWGSLPTILLVVSAFFGLFGSLGLALGVFHRFFLPAMRGPRPMPLDDLLRELQSRIGPPETGGKTS